RLRRPFHLAGDQPPERNGSAGKNREKRLLTAPGTKRKTDNRFQPGRPSSPSGQVLPAGARRRNTGCSDSRQRHRRAPRRLSQSLQNRRRQAHGRRLVQGAPYLLSSRSSGGMPGPGWYRRRYLEESFGQQGQSQRLKSGNSPRQENSHHIFD